MLGCLKSQNRRRMGIAFTYDEVGTSVETLRLKAKQIADQVKVS